MPHSQGGCNREFAYVGETLKGEADLSLSYTSLTSLAQACGLVWLPRSHKGERFKLRESHLITKSRGMNKSYTQQRITPGPKIGKIKNHTYGTVLSFA